MIPQPVDPGHFQKLYEQAYVERAERYGEKDPRTAEVARNLGRFLASRGERAAAEIWLRRALALDADLFPERHRQIAEDQEALAAVVTGERERHELHRQAARCDDPGVAASNLAKLAALENNDAVLLKQAVAKQELATGAQSAKVAVRLNDLGLALPPDQAVPVFRRALALNDRLLGASHPETATTLNNLANALSATGQFAAAEPLQRRALTAFLSSLGASHVRTGIAASNLADVLMALKRPAEAKSYFRQAAGIFTEALGPRHEWTREALENSR